MCWLLRRGTYILRNLWGSRKTSFFYARKWGKDMAIFSIGSPEQDGVVSLGCDEEEDIQNLPDYVK